MCGRFSLENVEKIFVRFDAENAAGILAPRYTRASGQEVPVVIRKSPNKVVLMKWGMIPHWAKDPKIGYKMINARAETVHPRLGSVYYRETKNLLMQITILNFETKLRSVFRFNLQSLFVRVLNKKEIRPDNFNGVQLRIRVWSKLI